jgi:hypothetical protein
MSDRQPRGRPPRCSVCREYRIPAQGSICSFCAADVDTRIPYREDRVCQYYVAQGGISVEEIAGLLGVTTQAVYVILDRALDKMRAGLLAASGDSAEALADDRIDSLPAQATTTTTSAGDRGDRA